jgi:hypothetical protein
MVPRGHRDGRDRAASTSERVYRALVRAYPEEVRRRYADEMVRYFGDLCREESRSRGAKGVALLWARTLPELFFTALKERGALFRRNAYLPFGPGTVAKWGALCALVGGSLGVAYHLINYSLLGALNIMTRDFFGSDPFMRFFTLSLLLCALSLSSLGLFGLYGAVVARTERPGLVAGAGAVFSTGSAVLWLATSGYAAISQLASGSALFAPFEWLWNTGTFVIPNAILFWFLGLLLLGIAAARQALPIRLRVVPLALFALILPTYLLGSHFETVGNPVTGVIVMGFVQSLPFVGVTLLGWILIKGYDSESLAVPSGPAESAGATRWVVRSVSQTPSKMWVLAALLVVLIICTWAYSARDDLYKTYLGLQPEAQNVGPAAYAAGERLELEKSVGGARVTLNSVYAEEHYVIVGYEVEDLQEGRRVGGHPAELQPLIGFEGDEEALQMDGLGTDVVELTDESGTNFRMVDNSGQMSEGPDNMVKGPLRNMVAFEPEQRLEPGDKHRFRLEVPLIESPVVQLAQKQPPPEPFEGGPFVFDFEVPVRAVQVIDVDQKDTAEGVTLTLDRVINSPGRPQAVVCYEAPDDEHSWLLWGGKGTHEGGWGSSGSMKGVSSTGCQKLQLNGPLEGRSSLEVAAINGMPKCPSDDSEAAEACHAEIEDGPQIRGPWRFEFEVPDP